MTSVLVLRLISGEEVLAEVEQSNGAFIVKNPCVVQFAPPAPGTKDARLALLPFLPYADQNTITIPEGAVLFSFKPVTEVLNRYNKIFGSGLIVLDSPKIQAPKIQTP